MTRLSRQTACCGLLWVCLIAPGLWGHGASVSEIELDVGRSVSALSLMIVKHDLARITGTRLGPEYYPLGTGKIELTAEQKSQLQQRLRILDANDVPLTPGPLWVQAPETLSESIQRLDLDEEVIEICFRYTHATPPTRLTVFMDFGRHQLGGIPFAKLSFRQSGRPLTKPCALGPGLPFQCELDWTADDAKGRPVNPPDGRNRPPNAVLSIRGDRAGMSVFFPLSSWSADTDDLYLAVEKDMASAFTLRHGDQDLPSDWVRTNLLSLEGNAFRIRAKAPAGKSEQTYVGLNYRFTLPESKSPEDVFQVVCRQFPALDPRVLLLVYNDAREPRFSVLRRESKAERTANAEGR